MYVYTYIMFMHACVRACTCAHGCINEHARVCVNVCVHARVDCACVSVHTCVDLCTCVSRRAWCVYTHECVCIWERAHVHTGSCVCMSVCMHGCALDTGVHACICTCVCQCVHGCVRMGVHMRLDRKTI